MLNYCRGAFTIFIWDRKFCKITNLVNDIEIEVVTLHSCRKIIKRCVKKCLWSCTRMNKYISLKNSATVFLTPQTPDTRDIFIILVRYCCVSDFQKGTDLHSCMHNNSVFTVGLRALETLKQSRYLLYGAKEGLLWYSSPDSKPFRLPMNRSNIILSDFIKCDR